MGAGSTRRPPTMRVRVVGIAWAALILLAAPLVSQERAPTSKKGLQVQILDDALTLGIHHAALNVQLGHLLCRVAEGEARAADDVDLGHGYALRAAALRPLDAQIRPLAAAGIQITLILLARATGDASIDELQFDPRYDAAAPNRLGAFRVLDEVGEDHYRRVLTALATRYGPDSDIGRAHGYVVGNEVNSHWWWYNLGRASVEEVAIHYAAAVRVFHDAIRAADPDARVYVSLEHHWQARFGAGDARQSCSGRQLLDAFAAEVRRAGDLGWHVAYHPYPEDLFDCRFWEDATAVPRVDSPRITFRNLEVLTDYLERDELRFEGEVRRVILSEQGFHCPDGADGPRLQAEAFARAWRKVEALEGIDAFHYHRHVDHGGEGGLRFGLYARQPGTICDPGERRPIWELFRVCDTPAGQAAIDAVIRGR
jgi:hypothetical protein